jgi:phosphoribosylamine--glycine ligase
MRILGISGDFSMGDLCFRLKAEGHDVRIFVADKNIKAYIGMLRQSTSWRKDLKWVGKDGLILFDTTGFGAIQEKLRKDGYSVFGGCRFGDKIEDDRAYGQKILAVSGVKTIPSRDFYDIDEAISFVRKNGGRWVVKQNGHVSKTFNYVGELESGEDVVRVLEGYRKNNGRDAHHIELQKRVDGVEIGVGRYFNGEDWVGPIEMNIEHKSFFNGGIGPKTFEMGTLMWFDEDEQNKLFQKTLAKLKPYLISIDYRGDIDINCIVNEKGAHPLEVTARFGFPALQLQMALSTEISWGGYLKALADGKSYDFRYTKQYGIVVLVATSPFPYKYINKKDSSTLMPIFFRKEMVEEGMKNIHFEGVSRRKTGEYYISRDTGFVLHVSGIGKTVQKARINAYSLIRKIVVPKMFYRTDIGLKFIEEEHSLLKKWGYLP